MTVIDWFDYSDEAFHKLCKEILGDNITKYSLYGKCDLSSLEKELHKELLHVLKEKRIKRKISGRFK